MGSQLDIRRTKHDGHDTILLGGVAPVRYVFFRQVGAREGILDQTCEIFVLGGSRRGFGGIQRDRRLLEVVGVPTLRPISRSRALAFAAKSLSG